MNQWKDTVSQTQSRYNKCKTERETAKSELAAVKIEIDALKAQGSETNKANIQNFEEVNGQILSLKNQNLKLKENLAFAETQINASQS
jgi:predicted  nucleic acid-binding Zn-ribbon protein